MVAVFELLRQALVQGQCARLGCAVVGHPRDGGVRGHGGGGDDVALFRGEHAREEGPDRVPVREEVDAEDLVQVGVRCLGDEVRGADAGVV